MTMYEKSTRWRDVHRAPGRCLPAGGAAVAGQGRQGLRRRERVRRAALGGDPETEDRVWKLLFDVFGHSASASRRYGRRRAGAEQNSQPARLQLGTYNPSTPRSATPTSWTRRGGLAELEAAPGRRSSAQPVPSDRANVRLTAVSD